MSSPPIDAIWSRAYADLVVPTERGGDDVFLWEYSQSVARSALRISRLPNIADNKPDIAAVVASALFHDAGWVSLCREGTVQREMIGTQTPPDPHRELGVQAMRASLGSVLSRDSLARAADGILSLGRHHIKFIESQIVADAVNLEAFGLASLWPTIRRGIREGKAIQAVLDTWNRRREYQYWDARIKDGFRFAEVRAIARQRLASYETFMVELECQWLEPPDEPPPRKVENSTTTPRGTVPT